LTDSQWAISCRKLDEKLANYCTEKRQGKLDWRERECRPVLRSLRVELRKRSDHKEINAWLPPTMTKIHGFAICACFPTSRNFKLIFLVTITHSDNSLK